MGSRRDEHRETLVGLAGPTTAGYIDLYAAALLKDARQQAGLSQRELARRANVPASTVNRIELGKEQPTIPFLSQLILATGLELRIGLQPFDDHDLVLDRRAAADPERQANAERIRDEFLDQLRAV